MDTNEYIEIFLDESREHLQAVNDNILKLEKQPEDLSIVNEIFRSAHTLKGMAATMGFDDITSLTHQMENVLDQIRNNKIAVSTELIDIIFLAIEFLEEMVHAISEGDDGKKDVSELVGQLKQIESGDAVSEIASTTIDEAVLLPMELDEYQTTVVTQAREEGFHVYHIMVRLTDDCVLKAVRVYMVMEVLENQGELIKSDPSVEEMEADDIDQGFSVVLLSKVETEEIKVKILEVSEIKEAVVSHFSTASSEMEKKEAKIETPRASEASNEISTAQGGSVTTSKTIRVNLERIDELMNLFEEVVIDRSRLEVIAQRLGNHDLQETVEHMTRVSSDMQGLILTMRMVPIEQVFNRFPRMVRGLAKDLHKEIGLEVIGAETELDRTVIDQIGDPLVHLIRNSVDHGIEVPSVRKQAGKNEEGKLTLRAFHSGNHVFIEIEDDGAGINRERVAAKAIESGLLTVEQSQTCTDDEIAQFILSSGFSTADKVSNISGRGVGLDVVKNKIESLGGQISIASKQGQGSKFSIELPLTLSILSALLVEVGSEKYAIPLSSIIETALLEADQILHAHGQKVMDFRGKVIPLTSLTEVFGVTKSKASSEKYQAIVIVKKGERTTGLIVDSFIGQREVVLKSLGDYMGDVFAISGATILGDGEVALIIDPNALIK